MFNVGNLFANLSLVTSEFSKGLNSAIAEARAAGNAIGNALGGGFNGLNQAAQDLSVATRGAGNGFKDVSRIVQGIMISQVFYAGATAIKEAASEVANYNNEIEQTRLAFKYLFQDADKANQFVGALQDFAATTPFTTQSAAEASRMLLSMGFAANQVLPTLRILSDASAVSGADPEKFNRIVYAMGEIKTMGTAQTRQLMQLAQAGIPVYDILEKKLGLTAKQLHNIGKEGISSNTIISAILEGLQERYKGASEEMSKTTRGLLSTLKDDFLIVGNLLTQGMSGAFKGVLSNLVDFTEKLRSIGSKQGLGGLMNALFPPEMQAQIRAFTQYVELLVGSFGKLLAALWPIGREFINAFVISFNLIAPIMILFVNIIRSVIEVVTSATPVVRAFVFTIMALEVAAWVSTSVLMLVRAVQGLAVTGPIARLVSLLAGAIRGLAVAMIENPMLALFAVLTGGLIALALSFKETTQWIDRFTASLGRLFGFNISDMWKPLDPSQAGNDLNQFYNGLSDMNQGISDGLDNTKDKAKNTAKAMKDLFVASFDEVHQIPDKNDKGDSGGTPSGGSSPDVGAPVIPKIPDQSVKNETLPAFKWPTIPPFPPFPPIPPLPPLPKFPIDQWSQDMANALKGAMGRIGGILQQPWPAPTPIPIPMPDFNPVYQKLKQGLGDIGKDVIGSVSDALGKAEGVCVNFGHNLSAGLLAAGVLGVAALTVGANNMTNTISGFLTNATNSYNTTFNGISAFLGATFTIMGAQVIQYASGTMTTLTTWFTNVRQGFTTFGQNVETQTHNTWQHVASDATQEWNGIAASFRSSWNSLVSTASSMGQQIVTYVAGAWTSITTNTTQTWNGITTFFSSAWQKISGVATQMSQSIPNPIKTMWKDITDVFTTNGTGIGLIFGTCVAGLLLAAGTLHDGFGSVFGKIGGIVEGAFIGIRSTIGGAMQAVIRGFNSLIDSLNNFHISIPDWVPDLGGKSFGFSLSHWAIPGFETGGIVGRDQIVRVGEKNKREAIIPLENSTAMAPFADAVAARISAQAQAPTGTSGGGNQPIMYVGTLIADDRSLKQLERKLQVVRIQESQRKGGR